MADGTVCAGSCWGKPSLWSLFCFSTLLSTVFKGSRVFDPESLGGWQRDTVREVDIVTGCLLLAPRESGTSWEGSTSASSCTARTATSRCARPRLGLRPVITPDAVITHEVGVSSATRPTRSFCCSRQGDAAAQALAAGKRGVGLALLSFGVAVRAGGAALASRGEGLALGPRLEGAPELAAPATRLADVAAGRSSRSGRTLLPGRR